MFIDPSLADASIPFEYDDPSALEEYGNESDPEFEEWYSKFSSVSEGEQKKMVLDKLRESLSLEDARMIDEMLTIIQKNQDKENTDLEFITKKLKEKDKDVNEIAVFQYYAILNALGILSAGKGE